MGSWPLRGAIIRGTAGGGVTHESGDTSQAQLLSDKVLKELARLGTDVARHFDRPQDIEWAYAAGRVWLLQARPMTALPPPPVRLNRRQRLLGSVLLEYLPIRPYPIDMTTWLPYGPAGMMAKVTDAVGIRGAFEGFLLEEDGVVDRLIPPSPRLTLGAAATPFRLLRKARRYDPSRWTEDPRFTEFLRRVDQLADRDLTTMPWVRLIMVPREALDLVAPVADLRIYSQIANSLKNCASLEKFAMAAYHCLAISRSLVSEVNPAASSGPLSRTNLLRMTLEGTEEGARG